MAMAMATAMALEWPWRRWMKKANKRARRLCSYGEREELSHTSVSSLIHPTCKTWPPFIKGWFVADSSQMTSSTLHLGSLKLIAVSYPLKKVASTLHVYFRACILDESEVVVHDESPYGVVDDVFQMTLSRLDNLRSFKLIAMYNIIQTHSSIPWD